MWWVWLPTVSALLCPNSIECGNTRSYGIGGDGCGVIHPPFVTISIAGCNYTDNYSFCSFNRMMAQYLEVKQGDFFFVPCEYWDVGLLHEGYRNRTADLVAREAFYRTQRLSSGTHPKRCDSTADCKLDSGEEADCVCSNINSAFCAISLGDDFMLGVFPYAKNNNQDMVDYLLSYQAAFNYMYSRVSCPMLFVENQLLLDIQMTVRSIVRPNPYTHALTLLPLLALTVL